MSYFKPISISLSPNVEKDDVKIALNLLIRPWLWRKGSPSRKASAERGRAVTELENQFKKYLGVKYAVSFNSGRSSLFAILNSMKEEGELKDDDEILVQAFTCNAVANPILWSGLKPVYIDCRTDDFNMDPEALESKITTRSRVVIVQHTFGLPADMEKIRTICASYNLTLIEDCAHSLGAEYNEIKVGSHSKAAFFSFSRDKVISSVYGGMAVTNDDKLGRALQQAQGKMGLPKAFWIFQQILHPILLQYVILPIYSFLDLGKLLLVGSQILHILSKAVSWEEKQGKRPGYFPKALPNAMAVMALNQFGKLEKFNSHREKIADYYYTNLSGTGFKLPSKFDARKNIFLRFTVNHKDAHDIIYEAWHKQNILLGDWYTTAIAPFDTKMAEMHYQTGMCPNAEWLSKRTLNLPTHINISENDAQRIVTFLKNKKWS